MEGATRQYHIPVELELKDMGAAQSQWMASLFNSTKSGESLHAQYSIATDILSSVHNPSRRAGCKRRRSLPLPPYSIQTHAFTFNLGRLTKMVWRADLVASSRTILMQLKLSHINLSQKHIQVI